MELLVIALIAFTSAVLSGLLGLGGAVILIPAYLYLPQMFGLSPLSVPHVSGMTSMQVLVSSIAGMMIHGAKGTVDKRLVLSMGIPMTITAFAGAYLSKDVSPHAVLTIFGTMALFSAVILLIRNAAEDQKTEFQFSFTRAVVIASVVGFFGGIVGAAGAFLLAPLMMIILKIPTRITIGSTLGIVIFSSAAASVGKLTTEQIPAAETIAAIAGAIPGMIAGSRMSHKAQPASLRIVLALLIASVGIGMIIKV
ncbi:MAG: sulfite exporter TauE/SafE family protein [Bacteroidota bacterium]